MEDLTGLERQLEQKDNEIFSIYTKIKGGISSILKATDIKRELNLWNSVVDYYTLHGYSHCEHVLFKLNNLLERAELNQYELFYILSALWLHDIGMVEYPPNYSVKEARDLHHITSKEYFKNNFSKHYLKQRALPGKFEFNTDDEKAICDIIHYHRRKENMEDVEESFERRGERVFLRFLAAVFRIADGLHLDNSRAPFHIYENNKETMPYLNEVFWEKHFPIKNIVPKPEKGRIEVRFSRFESPAGKIHGKDMHAILLQVDAEIKGELASLKGANVAHYEGFNERNRVTLGSIIYINNDKKPSDTDYYYNLDQTAERPTGWEVRENVGWGIPENIKDKLLVGPLTSHEQLKKCFVKTEKINKFINDLLAHPAKSFFLLSPANTGKSTLLNAASWEIFRQRGGTRSYMIILEKKVPTYEELMSHLREYFFVEDQGFICIFDRLGYTSANIPDPAPFQKLIQRLKEKNHQVWGAGRTWEEFQNRNKWQKLIEEEFEVFDLPGLLVKEDLELFQDKFKDFFPEEARVKRFWEMIGQEKEVEIDSLSQLYNSLKEFEGELVDAGLSELIREKVKRTEARYDKIYQSLNPWEYNIYCLAYKFPGIYKDIVNEIISQIEHEEIDYVQRMVKEGKVEPGLHLFMEKGKQVVGIVGIRLNDQSKLILEARRRPEAIEDMCRMLLREYFESELKDPSTAILYFNMVRNTLADATRDLFLDCVIRYKSNPIVFFILSLILLDYPSLSKDLWQEAVSRKGDAADDWFYGEILKNFAAAIAKQYNDNPTEIAFKTLLEAFHKDKEQLFNLGVYLWEEKIPNSALLVFEKLIGQDQNHSLAWNGKGAVLRDLGRTKDSLAAFEKSIELDPKLAVPWNGMGNVLSDLGLVEDALDAFNKSIELDPKDAYPWNGKGAVLRALGRTKDALAAFDKSIELDPKLAVPWHGKGAVLSDLCRTEEALAAYDRSIELAPKLAPPWNGKGNVLSDLGQTEEALAAYEKSIELDPKDAYPWNGKGAVLRALGRTKDALAAYDRSIELAPKLAPPWNGKGNVLSDLGRTEEALAAFDKSIELAPKSALPWNGKGNVLRDMGRTEEALAAYEKSIELDPKFAFPWNGKALTLWKQGKLDIAVDTYEEAIKKFPESISLRSNYSELLILLGNLEKADRLIEETIKLCSSEVEERNLAVMRITINLCLNRYEEARAMVIKFIDNFNPKVISDWEYFDIEPVIAKLPDIDQQRIKVIQQVNLGKNTIAEAKALWQL